MGGATAIYERSPAAPELRMFRLEHADRGQTSYSQLFSIVWVVEGAFDGWYRRAVHRHGPGQLKLKEPGEVHRDVRVHAPFTLYGVGFDVPTIERAADAIGIPRNVHFAHATIASDAPVTRLAVGMHRALRDPRATALEVQTAVHETLSAVLREHTEKEPTSRAAKAPRGVALVRDYLQAHYADKVTLDELALHAGLDKFHLVRAFRDEMGLPPYEYLTHIRVAHAADLLERGSSAAEAAVAVGLYDESQLHRHFRRILGVPPGRYGRSMRASAPQLRAHR